MRTLSELKPREASDIKELSPDCPLRLAELGFLPGEAVELMYKSPLGWPRAYLVMGGVVALRRCDADRIYVVSK